MRNKRYAVIVTRPTLVTVTIQNPLIGGVSVATATYLFLKQDSKMRGSHPMLVEVKKITLPSQDPSQDPFLLTFGVLTSLEKPVQ